MSKNVILQSNADRITKRDELFNTLSRETDRDLILVSASYLDVALEDLLRSYFSGKNKKPFS